jgi:L-lysine 2,3-aminomutase
MSCLLYVLFSLEADIPNLQTIRIGTKSISFWPYRFLTDGDADDILRVFEKVVRAGKSLAVMAHFNHYRELETEAVARAVSRIRQTGAQIRTQSPLLNHINADSEVWRKMWRKQVQMGMIPYYMFVARDTGAQHYFGVSLVQSWEIFRRSYIQVSGIARTVRGPSMSCTPGKVRIVGVSEVKGEKVFVCEFIQGRNPEWVGQPFFAKFDEQALWMDDLKPAFGEEKFFFENEFASLFA